MFTVSVLGASGFAGGELLRILARHPDARLVAVGGSTHAGQLLGTIHPYAGGFADMPVVTAEQALGAGADVVFCSLPHKLSMSLLGPYEGGKVVDLGGDFRLRDPGEYARWYGEPHAHPAQLSAWTYGLTELNRSAIAASHRVANPGCYAAAALLAVAPLLGAGVVRPGSIHIDGMSGVSGAGRAAGEGFSYSAVNENMRPYTPTGHKHIGEIEQELTAAAGEAVRLTFTPHLIPLTRGLMVTCVMGATGSVTDEGLESILADRFKGEPFVRVLPSDALPETRRLTGTNLAEVAARIDQRTGRIIAFAAIDNLGKGAAGQAVQNANVMLGLEEAAGLDLPGMVP